jgi:hypothetical protein
MYSFFKILEKHKLSILKYSLAGVGYGLITLCIYKTGKYVHNNKVRSDQS